MYTNSEEKQHSDLTLIIDGNWLLMSRIAVLSKQYGNDTEYMMKKLKQLFLRSITSMFYKFPEIDNVILVADGGSWRDDIEIPKDLQQSGTTYKGTRELTETLNWSIIFSEYEDLLNRFRIDSKIKVTKAYKVEGDDWCWYWSNKLNNVNTNVIIWSADRDLTQLVKTNNVTGTFTITLYSRGKDTTLTKQIDGSNDYNIVQLFSNPYFAKNSKLLKTIESRCTKVNQIDPNNVIIDKVFRGDVSDNILPSIKYNSKSGKEYRIKESQLVGVTDIYNDETLEKIVNLIYECKPYKNNAVYSKEVALTHLKYNRQLVAMRKEYYPAEILEKIEEVANGGDFTITKDISIVEQKLTAENNNDIKNNSESIINSTESKNNSNFTDFLNSI